VTCEHRRGGPSPMRMPSRRVWRREVAIDVVGFARAVRSVLWRNLRRWQILRSRSWGGGGEGPSLLSPGFLDGTTISLGALEAKRISHESVDALRDIKHGIAHPLDSSLPPRHRARRRPWVLLFRAWFTELRRRCRKTARARAAIIVLAREKRCRLRTRSWRVSERRWPHI